MVFDQLSSAIQSLIDWVHPVIHTPEFQTFGLVILFVWTIIPSAVTISEVFTIPLLALGVSPVILIIVGTLGSTAGNYILYLIGRGTHRAIKGKHKKTADADHFLHKYRHPIFFAVPFLLFIGDFIVILAGYKRIGFIKILPFLLIGETIRQTLSVYAILGLIQLPEILDLSFI